MFDITLFLGLVESDTLPFGGYGIRGTLMFAFLPMLLALLIYFLSKRYGYGQFRWLSMLPLVFGTVVGFFMVLHTLDPLYQTYRGLSTFAIFGHYLALIVPLLGISGLIAFDKITSGSKRVEL
ncbi:MAG: hypothetical protein MUC92_12880 [Fimbriimonadaceae bacterium]|jgi:hypothetical protein|nr:hypothetical protein [Fimbriimonadaceae bacterium]